jgi:hypothetical protein
MTMRAVQRPEAGAPPAAQRRGDESRPPAARGYPSLRADGEGVSRN